MKKWLIIGWLSLLFSGICAMFWFSEWKYSLPTPVPQGYHGAKSGDYIELAGKIKTAGVDKPVFIHFFNPDCPCSRFNIPYFKELVKQYDSKINFEVVALVKNKNYTVEEIQERFGLNIPVLFDSSLAASCGVYSTPQAVVLDASHRLFYRGNYNKSRYCTDKNSNYAAMAIDSLLNHIDHPAFNQFALTAYGCQLPGCTKPK